ncbi:hypothetical protein [Candidatus Spyradosoma sp. SGI.093]|uniref:hypothetical protein n=1 Tax=Candidatus Spyradosoma sp. SGI.093 TaxID=3420583 RepID=UPI003D0172F7
MGKNFLRACCLCTGRKNQNSEKLYQELQSSGRACFESVFSPGPFIWTDFIPVFSSGANFYEEHEDFRGFVKRDASFEYMKNRSFSYEQELRIAVEILEERQEALEQEGVILRSGNRNGKRHLVLKFDLARSIRRLYLSPKIQQKEKAEILENLHAHSCLERVRVYSSESTVR